MEQPVDGSLLLYYILLLEQVERLSDTVCLTRLSKNNVILIELALIGTTDPNASLPRVRLKLFTASDLETAINAVTTSSGNWRDLTTS